MNWLGVEGGEFGRWLNDQKLGYVDHVGPGLGGMALLNGFVDWLIAHQTIEAQNQESRDVAQRHP